MLMNANANHTNEPRPKTRPPQTPPPPPRTLKPFTQSERAMPSVNQSERARSCVSQSERARPCASQSERSLSGLLRLCTSASCGSSIDNKIEQALDLVKTHLRMAVRDKVQVLSETIRDLQTQNQLLEQENQILRTITHTY